MAAQVARGSPWDIDWTLEHFERKLRDSPDDVRAYPIGKLMRQAKPDDVFTFVSLAEIRRLWSQIVPFLGRTRPFWTWLLRVWEVTVRHERARDLAARAAPPG